MLAFLQLDGRGEELASRPREWSSLRSLHSLRALCSKSSVVLHDFCMVLGKAQKHQMHLGNILGHVGAVLGRSWPILAPILAHLAPLLAHPKPLLAHLGSEIPQ